MQKFNAFALPQPLLHRLEHIGFNTPTPIQEKAIPPALDGQDILGSAQTGTGKTAAFGIPLATYILTNPNGKALVLLPTRELASQVHKALNQLIGKKTTKTALLIGGEPMGLQMRQLKSTPRIIIGTPGRINDHLNRQSLTLTDTKFLVLDEVDRMLDMGFGIQLEAIAKYLSQERQTLMFSATMPKNIQKLSAKYLHNPVRIAVGETHIPTSNVSQEKIKVSTAEKYPRLLQELENREGTAIVFVKTKRSADNMANKLKKQKIKADALHGDLRQSKRNRVISAFRDKKYRVLVATDVAARGLDIPHIAHVINYDMPQNPEDYIHRIGRTARAGAKGQAANFISPEDAGKWRAIEQLLNPSAATPPADKNKKRRRSFKRFNKKSPSKTANK